MNAAERIALEAVARPLIGLYLARSQDASLVRKTAQSVTRIVVDMLQRGCMVHASATEAVRMSPTQQWLFAVDSVFRSVDKEVGPAATAVLVLRLSRKAKSTESSFVRIAADVNAQLDRAGRGTDVIMWEEAEGIYRAALSAFVKACEARGIGRDVHVGASAAVVHAEPPINSRRLLMVAASLMRRAAGPRPRFARTRRVAEVIPAERAVGLYREAHPGEPVVPVHTDGRNTPHTDGKK